MTNSNRSLRSRIGAFARAVLNFLTRGLAQRIVNMERALEEHRQSIQVSALMDWIAHASVPAGPLVSVVLPTRDRRAFLERAAASVAAQSYANWELIIVDDGSVDSTPDFIPKIDDPRVRSYVSGGRGGCAARNVALAHLQGEIVGLTPP